MVQNKGMTFNENSSNIEFTDEYFIRKVIKLSEESAKVGNDPFAALLVFNNQIVHSSLDVSVKTSDPIAHAELNVIREYCTTNKLFALKGFTLYSSTEPCIMCSGAIRWSGISKVVFSVSQIKLKEASAGNHKPTCESLLNVGKVKIKVVGPLFEEEGFEVFKKYPLLKKRERHKLLFAFTQTRQNFKQKPNV
jgi:tRNA(Arg) A34 adenosine deaminase TadA